MTNLWKDIPSGDKTPEEINIVVEIPKGSRNKFEIDHDTGVIKLDRVLHPPFKYGWNYGLIPRSFAEDGDPLDGIIFMDQAAAPGVVIPCRPIGIMHMTDQDEKDDKILCVPLHDPDSKNIKDLGDLPKHDIEKLKKWFENYKKKEGKTISINGFEGAAVARRYINEAIELYKKKFERN